LQNLEKEKFIITGVSFEEVLKNEIRFSYNMENPKTMVFDYSQKESKGITEETSKYFYEYFRENPTPFGAQIEITSRCNERCIHCYIPHEKKINDLPTGKIINLLDELYEMGTLGLTLSGGEMLMHEGIIEILKYARKKDFVITILSNLTLLSDSVISVIKGVNVNQIQVSLYSMDPNEHDFITKLPGSHKKTLNSIERLVLADIPVQISCPVMKTNIDSYRDVLRWAYEHKMKAYTDYIMMARSDFSTNNLEHRISIEQTEKLIKDIIDVDEDYRTILEAEPKSKDIEAFAKMPVCGVGVDNVCIAADGNIYPCSGWQGYSLGNVHVQTIKDIWNNSERIKMLRSITNSSFPECLKCAARDYCAMCMVRNFNENKGDMFKVSKHFCEAAFVNKRVVEDYKNKDAGK
jgi:radical SAM protein with 4Fe4S-binding SPASM domain